MRVLWIAPNLNHYKARVLNRLVHYGQLELTVLAGAPERDLGHRGAESAEASLSLVRTPVPKSSFHVAPAVYRELFRLTRLRCFDVVLMPCEKKHLPLVVFLSALRKPHQFSLATYTHPVMRSRGLRYGRANRLLTRIMFGMFDRVIFYTEESMGQALGLRLLPPAKASYANNTLDTDSIDAAYEFAPPPSEPRILFLGRLTPDKRVDLLLEYYAELRKLLPKLRLVVIGDGPQAAVIATAAAQDEGIEWQGALVDEAVIAGIMRGIQLVLVPGHSGLSIVHAFCYGRPYACIRSESQPPEIAYLRDGVNGLLLDGTVREDVPRLARLLVDSVLLESYCQAARRTARDLSVRNWCRQMADALGARSRPPSEARGATPN